MYTLSEPTLDPPELDLAQVAQEFRECCSALPEQFETFCLP